MASEPVRSTAVVAAPKDYSVAANQQIRLLSVTANFTDNGAAGDWLPAVVIEDNNGNALVRALDQGVKVTAGSSAEVSWFPGVKHSSGASSSGLIACTSAWDTSAGTIPAGTHLRGLTSLAVNSVGAFSIDAAPPASIIFNVAGVYLIHGVLALSSRAALTAPLLMLVTNIGAPNYSDELWDAPLDSTGKASFAQMEGAIIANVSAGQETNVSFTNSGPAIANVDHISLACVQLSATAVA